MAISALKNQYKIKQNKTFNHIPFPDIDFSLTQHNTPSGRYYTLDGDESDQHFFSVTTILHHCTEDIINEWKKNIGEERAKQEGGTASSLGTQLHDLSEHYLKNQDLTNILKNNMLMFHRFNKFTKILDRLDNIKCLEKKFYSAKFGMAGTVDCIAEFDGVLSIIDFKTSKNIKYESMIHHYFAQATAYAIMVYELYGIKIPNIAILISVENDEPLVYTARCKDYFQFLLDAIKTYKSGLGQ